MAAAGEGGVTGDAVRMGEGREAARPFAAAD